jgi:hypothetical protein
VNVYVAPLWSAAVATRKYVAVVIRLVVSWVLVQFGTAVQPAGAVMVGWVVFGERAVTVASMTSPVTVLPGESRSISVSALPGLSLKSSRNAMAEATPASAFVSVPVAVKVSPACPFTPIAPSSSSLFWVVASVAPDDGEALLPVAVAVRSRGVVAARPENSFALSVRRRTLGVVTEMVWPAV